jgi:hypothetical protein
MAKTGQDHHIITDLPSADEVWKSLLGELMETPLEIPGSWTDEASAKWDNNGNCLVVAAPPVETEGWVEKRFLPVARIYLEQQQPGKSLVVMQKGGPEKADLLLRVQRSVYDQIVEPQKIVPIQIYMFQHWLPVLGASAFWVAAAIRQVSFVSKAEKVCVVKPISSRVLAKWTPLRHIQVNQWLSKEGYTSWFFKKTKDSYDDVPPEYTVWSQIPIAPHHLVFIEQYAIKYREEESPAAILESLLDKTGEIRRIKPGELDPPKKYSKKKRSVLDIIAENFPGNISQRVADLAMQLEHQVTRPNLVITVPHYFFHRYGDDLSSNEAALIWYLRSLYKEEGGAEVTFPGYASIELALGCGNRTPKRLLEKCLPSDEVPAGEIWNPIYSAEKSLGNWLVIEYIDEYKNGFPRRFTIKIRTTEPIHVDDQGYYERLISKTLDEIEGDDSRSEEPPQNRTGGTQIRTGEEEYIPAQNHTGGAQNHTGATQIRTDPPQNRTGEEQKRTGEPRISVHLKDLNTNDSINNNLNTYQQLPLEEKSVVGVDEINIEKLLGFGSFKHNEKKKLKEMIQEKPLVFLAWIIRNHITAADFPVRLAVRNLKEGNETEDKYLEMASLGWRSVAELVSISETVMSMWEHGIIDDYDDRKELITIYEGLSKSARKEISKLRDTGFSEIYEDIRLGVVNV